MLRMLSDFAFLSLSCYLFPFDWTFQAHAAECLFNFAQRSIIIMCFAKMKRTKVIKWSCEKGKKRRTTEFSGVCSRKSEWEQVEKKLFYIVFYSFFFSSAPLFQRAKAQVIASFKCFKFNNLKIELSAWNITANMERCNWTSEYSNTNVTAAAVATTIKVQQKKISPIKVQLEREREWENMNDEVFCDVSSTLAPDSNDDIGIV